MADEPVDMKIETSTAPTTRAIRGGKIAMIFQEPMTSLNPVLTVGRQLTEMLKLHLNMGGDAARKQAIELMSMVGIPGAENRIDDYPTSSRAACANAS